MSWLGASTVIGIVAVAVLLFVYFRRHMSDQLNEIVKKWSSTSRIAEPARYVDSMAEIPVALILTDTAIHYENPDIQARLDLEHIDEVEYDDELATAKDIKDGRVLRLRSHGHTIEFIIDTRSVERWSSLLPPHRMDDPEKQRAV
ncbi:MAG TPA: hypothetical protein VMT00_07475 [Thermoanaerobaculia bacterium]|nr:hypothetical protein [Thermoanaerobaculia bacterium]